jgi:hypothetical protein
MKPKENKGYNTGYIRKFYTVWECASGEEVLVRTLRKYHNIISTDIKRNQDFFLERYYRTVIVTNPPYSIKYEWLERCYLLELPFALLMPYASRNAWYSKRAKTIRQVWN